MNLKILYFTFKSWWNLNTLKSMFLLYEKFEQKNEEDLFESEACV